MSDDAAVTKAIADYAEHLAHIPPALKARAVNAVGPALQARGEWLRLSTREAVAGAVIAALKDELDALVSHADVAGTCPACGGNSLFLSEGGHVTCSHIDCPTPDAADALLHGGETALIQALGGTGQPAGCSCHNGDELCSSCRRCPDICNGCDGPEYQPTQESGMAKFTINYLSGDTETVTAVTVDRSFDSREYHFPDRDGRLAARIPVANVRSIHRQDEAVTG
ncbi:DUF6085 family protein [Streptomyces sp. PD-S100-1]|uniref:DUF6085 family protein n=1 Tax=Streptomyces sp. PD-S100-1 TaxID=3394351 RepID=UPI0039BCB742